LIDAASFGIFLAMERAALYPVLGVMTDQAFYLNGPSQTPIERPRCPKCQTRMSLARITPGPKGFDIRNFECGKCDHVITVTVATDPMKSDKASWLAGELKPPALTLAKPLGRG
jgi:hypothetical protein